MALHRLEHWLNDDVMKCRRVFRCNSIVAMDRTCTTTTVAAAATSTASLTVWYFHTKNDRTLDAAVLARQTFENNSQMSMNNIYWRFLTVFILVARLSLLFIAQNHLKRWNVFRTWQKHRLNYGLLHIIKCFVFVSLDFKLKLYFFLVVHFQLWHGAFWACQFIASGQSTWW